ncbi:MAG: hypothetical protein BAJALOKI2v1_840007 [Promethearchaeota archaeon]|nr:MAG: hypothetical protein BAJALOKI2v1_840007 [Candidatus Lokiarchaeota archaeon]
MKDRVFLCGIKDYFNDIKELIDKLEKEGYSVTSSINAPFKEIEEPQQVIANKKFIEEGILNAHYVLIFNKNQNIDLMTAMNFQYALIHKKAIRLLFKTDKIELKAYCESPYYNVGVERRWQKSRKE